MGVFRKFLKGKNKKYSYSPRYYDDKGKGSPFKMEPRLDQFRSTAQSNRGLKRKLTNAMEDLKRSGDRNLKVRMTIIIAILILIFLYIIDFDLSIFYKK